MKVYKKNPNWMASSMAAMLLCGLLYSCSNEDFLESGNPEKGCGNICFGISPDREIQTRGYAGGKKEGYAVNRFVLRSKDSADTLCVRAIVSDGINATGLESEQIITRGEPISNTNFYDRFHVLAYWKKSGTSVSDQFYMDEDVTNANAAVGQDAIWSTTNTYYWPGTGHSFQFYAWAPTDIPAGNLATPASPESRALTYTVPEEAANQKDIVVATTDEIPGDHNKAVPLAFQHICTAVRFVVGSQMQPGSIKSVALKGVKHTGTYDMATGTWALDDATTNFSQTLNKETTGSETNGTEITTTEGTFMMLPQALPADAMVEVIFTNTSGIDRTLTASIGNTKWEKGTTVTYKLSISPEYELEFVSQPEVQDAHYVIYPITIKADDKLPTGGWTLTSDDTANVTFVEKDRFVSNDVQALVDAGYWLDGYNGTSTLTSTTTGEVQVYVFLKENATEADRNITLSLKPAAQGNYEAKTFSFTQYCPAWNGNIGVERIQDKDYPWGFNWDSSMTITYDFMSVNALTRLFLGWYLRYFSGYKYIEVNGVLGSAREVTINFSKLGSLTTATDVNNGRLNTWEIYNFNGINEASTLMTQLESWGGVSDKTLPTNPTEFAARACAMKNKYSIKVEEGNQGTAYRPVLDQANMVWYLPAQNEAPYMNDNLSGNYWTSTAITNPGTTAYKYTTGGSTSPEDRSTVIHVRAVRAKP